MLILVVDDDEKVRDALSSFLRHDGHTVRVAADPSQARHITDSERPDAIVLVAVPLSPTKCETVRQVETDDTFVGIPIFVVGDHRNLRTSGITVAPRELHDLLRGSAPTQMIN